MASGMCKLAVIGNLGKDPEVKFSQGGTAVCSFSVACTERVKKKEEWTDHTEWVRVVCFGKTAENAGKYLAKGRRVYAEGRLQTSEWDDKEGKHRTTVELVADRVQFIDSAQQSHEAQSTAIATVPASPAPAHLSDDEIPF